MSRTASGANRTASRTPCGPSTRNWPCRERAERPDSALTCLTRSARGFASVTSGMLGIGRSGVSGRPGELGSGSLGRVHVRGQRVLGDLDERVERRHVVDRELREDATVDLDTRGLEALDEAVVGHFLRAGRSVDALDPQLAEVALLGLAVTVGVDQRVGDLLLRLAVEARALAAVAAGALESRTALLVGVDRPLHACHVMLLAVSGRKWSRRPRRGRPPRASLAEQLLDRLDVSRGNDLVHRQTAGPPARLVLQVVARVGLLAHDLAAARDPETLL